MGTAKLHHYVPQFYLRRFENTDGRLWVWDKTTNKSFQTGTKSVAAQSDFYKLNEFAASGRDALTMEKQFAGIEAEFSLITEQWLNWLIELTPGEKIQIPTVNRQIVSTYIALQFLRTADAKDIICAFEDCVLRDALSDEDRKYVQAMYLMDVGLAEPVPKKVQDSPAKPPARDSLSDKERTRIHTEYLWDQDFIGAVAKRIEDSIWIFGRNLSEYPFFTSDNPVAFKTGDNRKWIKAGFLTEGTYVVFPLSPQIVMYCKERNFWHKVAVFDNALSPADFTLSMVEHENAGQVFMAGRFVISSVDDFKFAREFAQTIGTDRYAPQ
jgi:Protein of unknown function (DUF4238)